MTDFSGLYRKITHICVMLAVLLAPLPSAFAQSALTILRGANTRQIELPLNRALVLQSASAFAEISVANPDIADVAALSERNLYVLGKTAGTTSLTLLDANGLLITNVSVRVTPDISEFKQRLREILPGEPIAVRTASDGLVLSGQVSDAQTLDRALDLARHYSGEKVTNLMSVGGAQQVMLKVRFAEMQRSVSKNLSSSLGIGGRIGGTGRGAAGNGLWTNPVEGGGNTLDGLLDGNPGNTGITAPGNSNGLAKFAVGIGGLEFDLVLQALESKGMVRTLAEPNIVALSGEEAEFLAGGEYPVPIQSRDEMKIEFHPFGVALKFKPVVGRDDRITLSLNAEVSALDPTASVVANGLSVSGFSVRRTQTTVELRDGESFAIAGLLQDNFNDLVGQVPWLGDLPVLGSLFRSTAFERRQSELVVIITAHLVRPVQGEMLAMPTERLRIPTERELFLHGKVAGAGEGTDVARQGLHGAVGYVLK